MTDTSAAVDPTTTHGLPIELTTTPTTSYARRVGGLALTVAAVAGALSLAVALLFAVTGVTPLVFQSGSMGPRIPTGSLALARTVDAEDLTVGDVVSVRDDAGTRVTHRVAAIADGGALTLKGDANLSVDADTYLVDSADRVFVSVPRAGAVLSTLTGPAVRGLAAGLGLAVVLVLVSARAGARPGRTERVAVLGALVVVLGVGVGVARAPEGTSAFWTDSVAGTSRITVRPPTTFAVGCSASNGIVTLSWAPVAGATSYDITVPGASSGSPRSQAGTSVTIASAKTGGAAIILPNGNDTYAVTVVARPSSASGTSSVKFLPGNISTCG